MRQRLDHAAAGVEQHVFLGENDLRCRAVFEVIDDQIAEIVNVHHDPLDSRRNDMIEAVIDEGGSLHADQRLRRLVADRPHALSPAGREEHGCLREGLHAYCLSLVFSTGIILFFGGTVRSSHARSGAKAGCLQEFSRSCQTRGMCAR